MPYLAQSSSQLKNSCLCLEGDGNCGKISSNVSVKKDWTPQKLKIVLHPQFMVNPYETLSK